MVLQLNNGFNSLAWDLWSNEVHANAHSMLWIPAFDGTANRYMRCLESAARPEDVARIMNMDGGGPHHIRPWNFWPLVPPGFSYSNFSKWAFLLYSTNCEGCVHPPGLPTLTVSLKVEYNLASGSYTAADAVMWIDLVCLFVRGAFACNGVWARGTLKGRSRVLFVESDLLKFVLEQAHEVGLSEEEEAWLRQRLAFPGKGLRRGRNGMRGT
ncbi:hypothetical protein GGR51DRAFT_508844 [Nemania sp. FL0031]|nr:hypothetical protein GGR51DRAFT_508844 [Nemania sp. FL0031]